MPSLDKHRVADAVRARRGELDWTQQHLAEIAGVNAGTISTLERGERWPWTRNQHLIERALGWEPGTLQAIGTGGPVPVDQGTADRPRYLDPAEQHIADTPGLSPEESAALVEVARAMRANKQRQTGT